MRKSKSLFLGFLMLSILFSACGSPATTIETTIPTEPVVEVEATTVSTEGDAVPDETEPVPMEITDFVLETVNGADCYTMNGFSYPAFLGAPELGLEGAAALYQEGDLKKATSSINNVADAVYYLIEMDPFTDSLAACNVFIALLEDNFKDLGTINLRGEDFVYSLAYVRKDNVYYPFDIFNIANGWSAWITISAFR